MRNKEFEAAILLAPLEGAPYLAYGEWLHGQGQPQGELAQIQNALSDKPYDAELVAAEEALMKANTELFFGSVPPQAKIIEPVFAPLESWRTRLHCGNDWSEPWPTLKTWHFGYISSVWKNGFVEALLIDTERGFNVTSEDAAGILAEFLALPVAQFVRRIYIGKIRGKVGDLIDAVVDSPCAATVYEFVVHGGDDEFLFDGTLNAENLWQLPKLETAILYGYEISLGTINAPRLKHLAVQSEQLQSSALQSITSALCPALENLEIWLPIDDEDNDDNNVGDTDEYGASLEMLLTRDDLHLKRLVLWQMKSTTLADRACIALTLSPLVNSLEVLDITNGKISEAGAQRLVDAADYFEHLGQFDITAYVSEELAEKMRALAKDVWLNVRAEEDDDAWMST